MPDLLEAVSFLSPVLAVSCFGGLSCSPLWVRGSFLRGPLGVASGVLSRPFLLLPTVESLGFGSHASARPTFAALSFVLSFVLSDVAVCMCMCACTMDPGGRWRGRGVG